VANFPSGRRQADAWTDLDLELLLFGAKRCPLCGRELPASTDFYGRDRTTRDGLTRLCSECRSREDRRRYRSAKSSAKLTANRTLRLAPSAMQPRRNSGALQVESARPAGASCDSFTDATSSDFRRRKP